ncbi:hypothetical protein OQJ19_00845 [Fluoribacter gormanii]|uniref:Uncharacterized protein n=1 Tax=Fluoribacter gormanii TaxID=464 RepID=A0A377GIQ8_9GAMM|nr:hypothetical protein [Fluoribacter gormanii]KTD03388.1 hypothetical protein Lgor_1373 [Fluoribacter gormanii]MCW8444025.1 hypothetical protein [Fluoribacter gormanii]MCW8469207.1 hypothetical protein [Fluoribacter gormanii]SIQ50984.1 hypothetical protein SAMN05421777_101192 [Fluoribacter gormanii]STO24415.1 Uncharacterised protein [Fluoribacter gormanii]
MNLIFKGISAVALSISALTAFASPTYLITHNNTPEESNAYIAGVPSAYPTPANSTQKVYWNLVKLACYGHTTGKQCSAVIKMATNTSNPIEVGEVRMDLDTGDITPKFLSKNGYNLTINGPGEATITKK